MPPDDTGIIPMSDKQAKMHQGGGGGAAVIDSYDTKKSEKFRWRAARVTRPRGDDYVQLKIAVAPSKRSAPATYGSLQDGCSDL